MGQSFKSTGEQTLKERLEQCNETALVPCGHFEQSFKSTGEQTLKERLEQCNETALVPCGHFERSFRTLSDHSVKCLTAECQEQALWSLESMLGADVDTNTRPIQELGDRPVYSTVGFVAEVEK